MKKYLALMLALLLIFSLAGCGNSNTDTQDPDSENQDGQTADNADTSSKEADLSSLDGLSGQALYEAAMALVMPNAAGKSYQIEAVSTDADGQQSTTITTVSGENFRVDTKTDEGVSVYIYNSEEGATYSYDETTKQGFKMNESIEDYSEDFDEGLSEDDDSEIVVSAELGEFLGRKVLIVVFDASEDYGEYENEVWYDLELGATLKWIMRENDAVVQETTATKVDAKFKADKSTFVPPSDIQIAEVNY